MSLLPQTTKITFRGTTVAFSTTFFDVNNAVVQPQSAVVNLVYLDPDGTTTHTVFINMTAPTPPAANWTALWDSRGAGPGTVAVSIHSVNMGIPVSVEDLEFTLTANAANLVTF